MKHSMVILIGLPGTGKTTIGKKISAKEAIKFFDFDDELPPSLKKKMAAGLVISDSEREPFFKEFIAKLIEAAKVAPVLAACVLVKEKHRRMFHQALPSAIFLHLHLDSTLLFERIRDRHHEFLTPETLEKLILQDEPFNIPHTKMDASQPPSLLTAQVVSLLKAEGSR